jgi:hypothetical protein
MVHTWIVLRNDRVTEKCVNSRVTRLFKNKKAYFYGDYDLDVYLGSKHDDMSLEATVAKVIDRGTGWLRNIKVEKKVPGAYNRIDSIISEFGRVDDDQLHKFLPRKESGVLKQSFVYRKDGNFSLIACESERFYYVFAFATS